MIAVLADAVQRADHPVGVATITDLPGGSWSLSTAVCDKPTQRFVKWVSFNGIRRNCPVHFLETPSDSRVIPRLNTALQQYYREGV